MRNAGRDLWTDLQRFDLEGRDHGARRFATGDHEAADTGLRQTGGNAGNRMLDHAAGLFAAELCLHGRDLLGRRTGIDQGRAGCQLLLRPGQQAGNRRLGRGGQGFRIDGTWAWSDQAFSIHLVSEADRGPGEPSDNAFVPLTVVLVDSNTGRVAALSMVTMSPRFARTFRGLIDKQRASPFDPEAHKRTIAALYTKYRTSKDLADAALLQERAGSNLV